MRQGGLGCSCRLPHSKSAQTMTPNMGNTMNQAISTTNGLGTRLYLEMYI